MNGRVSHVLVEGVTGCDVLSEGFKPRSHTKVTALAHHLNPDRHSTR